MQAPTPEKGRLGSTWAALLEKEILGQSLKKGMIGFMNDTLEAWSTIPGFENYQVSNLGRIRRQLKSSWRILDGKIDKGGYRYVGLVRARKQFWIGIHRLVACTFLDPSQLSTTPDKFLTVNHKDRNRLNNSLENLELMTVAQNNAHWRIWGLDRLQRGEK